MKKAEREYQAKVRNLGCIICESEASIHHALTGGGGRKNEMKVLPLCPNHHTGENGIHQGRRKWQETHGSEVELMAKVNRMLGITFI